VNIRPKSKEYLFDFETNQMWELSFYKQDKKTWLEASFGETVSTIKENLSKRIFEGEDVFPYWTYNVNEIKKRYYSEILEHGKPLDKFPRKPVYTRVNLPKNKLTKEVFELYGVFWRTCLFVSENNFLIEVWEQTRTPEIRISSISYDEVVSYRVKDDGFKFIIYEDKTLNFELWFEYNFVSRFLQNYLKEKGIRI